MSQAPPPTQLPRSSESGDSGYPLATLFLLVALCGILMGMTVPLGRAVSAGNVSLADVVVASVSGGVIVGLLGAMIGIYHHRRVRGVFLGGAVGVLFGMIAGPLSFAPRGSFPHLLVIAIGGSVLLLVIGAVVRMTARSRRVEADEPGD